MRKKLIATLWLGILTATVVLLTAFRPMAGNAARNTPDLATSPNGNEQLQRDAFDILEAKCNSCHRRQNPFMVFKLKNMAKRAPKIHRMVFIERRMPKGDEIRLSYAEYTTLEKWLFTENIY